MNPKVYGPYTLIGMIVVWGNIGYMTPLLVPLVLKDMAHNITEARTLFATSASTTIAFLARGPEGRFRA